MMAGILQVLGITMLMITVAHCLSCVPIELRNCTAKNIVQKRCPLGVAKDICGQCWVCAMGFKESCGGIWNLGGTCAARLRCTNPYDEDFDYSNQLPGICCRNTTTLSTVGKRKPAPKCKTCPVINPCSGVYERKKSQGQVCGGPGDIKGVCADNLVCYPPLTDETRDKNSTCTFPSKINATTSTTGFN